jgi:hypothetical protein
MSGAISNRPPNEFSLADRLQGKQECDDADPTIFEASGFLFVAIDEKFLVDGPNGTWVARV